MDTTGAGHLYEHIAFDKRIDFDDGMGNYVADWEEQFQTHAQFIYLRGGEAVMAAKLASHQPIVVRIRKSAAALLVTGDYRCRNVRTGHEYNIRTITPDVSRGWLDVLVEAGVAV
jgi:head-tail adaptor